MNKLLLALIMLFSIQMPTPAQAGIWQSFRNSTLITALFGKPVAVLSPDVNYTKQTRLPAEEIYPWWHRIFNFYSWMNFRKSPQPAPEPAPQPAAEPVVSESPAPKNTWEQFNLSLAQSAQLAWNIKRLQKNALQKKNKDFKKLQENHEKEKAKLQQSLSEKKSEVDLLIGKLERDESNLKAIAASTQAFESRIKGFSSECNNRLNRLDGKLTKLGQALTTETPSSLPMISAEAGATPQSAGLLQSTLPQGQSGDDDFVQLSKTPSPELPVELVDNRRTSPGVEDVLQIDPVVYRYLVDLGEQYLNYLDTDQTDKIPTKSQDEYIDSIRAIVWRMYDRSLAKKQGATELMFVIKDQAKLHNFLFGFVKKVNPEMTGTNKDPLAHISFNQFAYSRDASHFTHLKKEHRPYGIDMRYTNGQKALLPTGHSHILFGFAKADRSSMYLKPEHHGLFYLDGFFGHIHEFVVAQFRKDTLFAKGVRALASFCGYTIETDDAGLNRKERIPTNFLKAFAYNLAQAEELTSEQKHELNNAANRWGIQTLHNNLLANIPLFQNMLTDYNRRFDHTDDRFGNEIKFSSLKLEIAAIAA